MLRRLALASALAAILVGCLFPSFDDLKRNGATAQPDPGDDDDTTSGTSGKSTTSSGTSGTGTSGTSGEGTSGTSGSTSSSSGAADTGADTNPPAAKTIKCGNQTCNVGTQVCCDNGFGDVKCDTDCSLWTFRCDDVTDCPSGQRCCSGGIGELDVKCKASCDDDEVCTTDTGCKSGKCNGTLGGPPDVTFRVCQ